MIWFVFILIIAVALFMHFMLKIAEKHDDSEKSIHEKRLEQEAKHIQNLNYIREKLEIQTNDFHMLVIDSIAKILEKLENNERTSKEDH
jgi:hypothetical protein